MTDAQGAVKPMIVSIEFSEYLELRNERDTLTAQLQAANERADKAMAEAAVLLASAEAVAIYHTNPKDYEMDNGEAGVICDWTALFDLSQAIDNPAPLAIALLSQVAALKEGLRPFAEKMKWPLNGDLPDSGVITCQGVTPTDEGGKEFAAFGLNVDDFRRAAALTTDNTDEIARNELK